MRYSGGMKTRCGWWAVCWLAVVAVAATNEVRTLKIYPFDPNNAAVIETVRALVGADGLVTPDRANSRVLVITTVEHHRQLGQALPALTVTPRNVQVEVRFRQAGRAQQRGASLEGSRLVLEPNPLNKGSFKVRGVVTSRVTTTTDDTTQLLTVSSGREAALFVGQEVPYLDFLQDYLVYQRVLVERVSWEKVGAQLLVQPTIIGDGPHINIRLIPQLSGLVEGKPYMKKLTELATEVEVADGRTLQIGGLGQHAEFYDRFLVGFNQDGSTQSLNITLTPHILPAAGGVR
ncbi:MAG: hypothetical protein EPN23_03495 [Verrucomicrobia bacterium]|nr:MAG: hypothetical protein EPN23_03495 [Verrucomicrobiota bacterium]